ncbi:MAG: glycosyltransferase family 2 protein [Gaiellaceae bacterium]
MTSPPFPTISVVVPTHQRRECVLRLLRCLATQDVADAAIEAVVAVDRSTDGTAEAVDAFEAPYRIERVEAPSPGRAAACNAGVAAAAGEIILLLDDDMEPTPSCLRRHLDRHHADERACVMGAVPVILDGSSSYVERYVAAKFAAHSTKLAQFGRPAVLRDFYSGNASIRRSVLDEVGLFDPSFTQYGNEDLELAFRLRSTGVSLQYEPEAVAHQRYTKSFMDLGRDSVGKGRTAVLLARLHPATFPELRLAEVTMPSPRWRSGRSILLSVTGGRSDLLIRFAGLLEHLGVGQHPLFYSFLLDCLYWAGAMTALGESGLTETLEPLERELRRGPIDLLLHR